MNTVKLHIVYGEKGDFTLYDVLRETMVIRDSQANEWCRITPDGLIRHGSATLKANSGDIHRIEYAMFRVGGSSSPTNEDIKSLANFILRTAYDGEGVYSLCEMGDTTYDIMWTVVAKDE